MIKISLSPLFITLLISVFFTDTVFADSTAQVVNNISQLNSQVQKINQFQGSNCLQKTSCPYLIGSMNTLSKDSQFFGFIKSSQSQCESLLPKNQISTLQIYNDITKDQNSNLHENQKSLGLLCLNNDTNDSAKKLTQVYYTFDKLESIESNRVAELNFISQMLGTKAEQIIDCNKLSYPRSIQECKKNEPCGSPNDVQQMSKDTIDAINELTDLNKQIEDNDKEYYDNYQKYRRSGYTDYQKRKKELATKKDLIQNRFPWLSSVNNPSDKIQKIIENKNPLSTQKIQDLNSITGAINDYFKLKKELLKKEIFTAETFTQCLQGSIVARSCTQDTITKFIAENETDEMNYSHSTNPTKKNWYPYQECIFKKQNEGNEKNKSYWQTTVDVTLTVAPMGIAKLAIRGATEVAGPVIPSMIPAMQARKAALVKTMGALEGTSQGLNLAKSVNSFAESCFNEIIKLSSPDTKKSQPKESVEKSCPLKSLFKYSEMTKELENCTMNATMLALDGIPITSSVVSRLVKNKTLKKQTKTDFTDSTIEKRSGTHFTKTSKTDEVRKGFTDEFRTFSPTTTQENSNWITQSRKSLEDINSHPPKHLYFVDEFAELKNVNQQLIDRDYVTALGHFRKKILSEKMKALEKKMQIKYPQFKMSESNFSYSDFKSVRYSFHGDIPPELADELKKLYSEVNAEYIAELYKRKLVRAEDKPETWFRGAIANTDEQASYEAKRLRGQSDNVLSTYGAESANEIQQQVTEVGHLLHGKGAQTGLFDDLQNVGMAKKIQTGEHSGLVEIDEQAIDILRKNKEDLGQAKKELMSYYHLEQLPDSTVNKLKDYLKIVDNTTPSLHIDERKIASLSAESKGGVSADMVGMGSMNLSYNSIALQKIQKKLSDLEAAGKRISAEERAKIINETFVETRRAEQQATAVFLKRQADFTEIAQSTLGKERLKVICSGDDCIINLTAPLSYQEKVAFVRNLAQKGYSGKFRMSFVNAAITDQPLKNKLASQGESIEKSLRKSLSTAMNTNKLKGINFGIDMQATEIGDGPVQLIVGTASDVKMTPQEQKLIQEKFQLALRELNFDLKLPNHKRGYFPTP